MPNVVYVVFYNAMYMSSLLINGGGFLLPVLLLHALQDTGNECMSFICVKYRRTIYIDKMYGPAPSGLRSHVPSPFRARQNIYSYVCDINSTRLAVLPLI